MVHRFTLILKDTHGIIDDLTGKALMDLSDALFEAGCDDASPGISCGIISVPIDREADSLREAVVSAIHQVHQAGYQVERVVSYQARSHVENLMVYEFELILNDTHGIVDDLTGEGVMEMADALFEAGCDDCTPGKSCGIITVGFDREANSLEAAIRSAIADVQSAGYSVARVEVNPPPFVDEINAQLAEGSAVSN